MTLDELKKTQGVGWPVYDLWLRSAEELIERHQAKNSLTPRHEFDVMVMKVCASKSEEELEHALRKLKSFVGNWAKQLRSGDE